MKSPPSIWRAMTGAEQVVASAALLALVSCVAFAAVAVFANQGDITNPDAAFDPSDKALQPAKKQQPGKRDRTVEWPRFGYDLGRSKFLDAQNVRPPFRKVWKWQGEELIEFAPIAVEGRLYFIDNDGVYIAMDAETGKIIWRERLTSLNASSPAYEDGVLYSVALEPGQALAVRARDGKVLWRKELPSRAESSPLVRDGRMYFGTEAGTLFALETKNGKTIWETGLAGEIKAAPAFNEGKLYIGDYGGEMSALRASDGEILWQTGDIGTSFGSGRIYSTAAVAFGRVYAGNVDGRVYSFDQETGEVAWTFTTGNFVYSGIAAADTKGTKPTVYFGSHDASMYAVDAKSGDLRWEASPGGQVSGPATVVGDVVYISTFSGNSTTGFDLGTGRRVFKFDDGEYGPVVSDGVRLYLTGGASILGFDPVDLGNYDYEPKQGERGIVPPKERRRIAAKQRAAGNGKPGGKQAAGSKQRRPGRVKQRTKGGEPAPKRADSKKADGRP